MDHIGIDVHKRDSHICILAEGGEVIERRCRTERERLAWLLGERGKARIAIEASTESEWVAQYLEAQHSRVDRSPRCADQVADRLHRAGTRPGPAA